MKKEIIYNCQFKLPNDDLSSLIKIKKESNMFTVYYADKIASTNDSAKTLSYFDYPHGAVVLANSQTQGKGRRGRAWFSPYGVNIYMTILLKGNKELAGKPFYLINFVACLSVTYAIMKNTNIYVWPKWPNDIYLGNKKLGGVLSEAVIRGNNLSSFVCGIGVNVNMKSDQIMEDIKNTASSLYIASGTEFNRGDIICDILLMFEELYNIFLYDETKIIDRFIKETKLIAANVEIITDKTNLYGTVKGIDKTGMLVLELVSGDTITVSTGDVIRVML
ncbi:biotin-[acetyl-CoA-carboxylase] ligase [Candidatus Magnetoovum chiemensis]|nr:biotin-[acetyl-CoA-carboxylase] ligase [Candidatus Magnetoovum chiemensis]